MVRTSFQRRQDNLMKNKEEKKQMNKEGLIRTQRNKIQELEDQLEDFEKIQESSEAHLEKLNKLYNMGLIDSDEEPINKNEDNDI